jgi:hypothetical protein
MPFQHPTKRKEWALCFLYLCNRVPNTNGLHLKVHLRLTLEISAETLSDHAKCQFWLPDFNPCRNEQTDFGTTLKCKIELQRNSVVFELSAESPIGRFVLAKPSVRKQQTLV